MTGAAVQRDRARVALVFDRETTVGIEELSRVFRCSGIRRPHDDPKRLARMLQHANLIVTARAEGHLVGIARCLSDFSWCCYISDLAVDAAHQRQGIGKRLVGKVQEIVGEECTLILNAAPGAEDYYPHIGFESVTSAWKVQRRR